MLPYIICFCAVGGFSFLCSRKAGNNSDAALRGFFICLVIFIPSIMAGFRNLSIGTDVIRYTEPTFSIAAQSSHFIDAIHNCRASYLGNIEPGFLFLCWVLSRFTGNVQWLLFVAGLIIQLFVFAALWNLRDAAVFWIGEVLFLLIGYNESYNITRQCIALSILLFGLSFALKGRSIRAFFWCIFAYLFHRSSVIGLFMILVFLCFRDNTNCSAAVLEEGGKSKTAFQAETKKKRIFLGLCLCLLLLLILFPIIMRTLLTTGLLPAKYAFFLNNIGVNELGEIPTFLYLSLYLLVIPYWRNLLQPYSCLFLIVCDILFYFLRIYTPWFYRVSDYFLYFRVLTVPQLFIRCEMNRRRKYVLMSAVLLWGVIYWLYFSVYWNNNETVPYLFCSF